MAAPGFLYGPIYLYFSALGTTQPAVSATTLTGWTSLVDPNKSAYTEDGVTISTTDTTELVFSVGSTAPQDSRLVQRQVKVTGTIQDVRAEALAKLIGDNESVSTTSVHKQFSLNLGSARSERAMLVRGASSPHSTSGNTQLYVPRAANITGEYSLAFVKGQPAMVQFEFVALEHSNGVTAQITYGV